MISLSELKAVFGAVYTEEDLKRIMAEADTNGDDKITFEEFKEMMRKFKEINSQLQNQWSF